MFSHTNCDWRYEKFIFLIIYLFMLPRAATLSVLFSSMPIPGRAGANRGPDAARPTVQAWR